MSRTRSIEPLRMLIVEDERIVAADLQATLESLGYEVVAIADTGQKAIRQTETARPDLVLMDIHLKGSIDGITTAEEIRRRWSIPIVFVTGNADDETLKRAKAAAPYGYVIKPFRTKDLNATIRVALTQHKLANELFAEHTWLLTTLGSINDGFIATDEKGSVRYMNPAAEELTGWNISKAAGKPIEEVYSLRGMNDEPIAHCQLRRALASAAPIPKQRFLMVRRDGKRIPVEDAAAPIMREEALVGAVTVFTDITERLRREREEELEHDRLAEEVHIATEALDHTRGELRALSAHLMTVQEEESRRIGRELHDDFGQKTAALEWQLEQLSQMSAFEGQAKKLFQAVRSEMGELSEGIRDTSHRLYPSVLGSLGLVAGVRQLVDSFCDAGIDVSLRTPLPEVKLPLEVSTALYRITQEALRNVAKHSPDAAAQVILSESADGLQLTIEDSGHGFDPVAARARGGLGLISMQERARLAGGSLSLRTAPETGTQIVVRVPRVGHSSQ